jgi:molybdate transport system substrate-binding protein
MSIAGGVTVFCDPTLAPAFRALDGLGGVKVAALSAPASLMLAQITRHTRSDVLFTLATAMDQAVAAGLVKPQTRIDGFCNTLVLAGLGDRTTTPTDHPGLLAMLATARVAVTDASPASGLDGRAVLAANQFAPPNVLGAANTGDVAFLVTTGAADLGLVYLTDAKADPRLTVIATLSADKNLTDYAGAVNAKALSPNAQAFLNALRGPAAGTLRSAGLTVAA